MNINFNWQWIVAVILLVAAIIYLFKTFRKPSDARHDCPDCDVMQKKPTLKSKNLQEK